MIARGEFPPNDVTGRLNILKKQPLSENVSKLKTLETAAFFFLMTFKSTKASNKSLTQSISLCTNLTDEYTTEEIESKD